jgi:hypothetical protein
LHRIVVRSLAVRHPNGLSLRRWYQKYEIEAVATLTEQLVNAMANYISACHEIPIEKSCDFSSSSMDTVKSEFADKRELAKVLVWNKNLEIVEVLSLSNKLESQELSKFNKSVLLIHDMGESSCSDNMRKLIKESYKEKLETAVITLDYSSVVS